MENNRQNRIKLFNAVYESMSEADIKLTLMEEFLEGWRKSPDVFKAELQAMRRKSSPILEKHGIPLSDDEGGE
tara:strand:- start:32 stop:250 length:219 start_codon:yes stop_codon:yes gene_type:complete